MDEIDQTPSQKVLNLDREKSNSANDIQLTQRSEENDGMRVSNAKNKEYFEIEFDKNSFDRSPRVCPEEKVYNINQENCIAELPEFNKKIDEGIEKSETYEEKKQKAIEIMKKYESNKEEEEVEDNDHHYEEFSNRCEYWLSIIGYVVGFANIWRFPYLLYSNGGGAFLIVYVILTIFICIPLFLLETAYGQLTKAEVYKLYSRLSPKLKGITYASLFIGLIGNVYYVVLIMWSITFLINSFRSPLPWTITAEDKYYYHNYYNTKYFKYNLLESSDSIENVKYIVMPCFISLLVAWLIVYILICRGIKSSGKFVYIATPLPFIILFILLMRGVTLEGSMTGWSYLFNPDFSKLLSIKVWRDAVNQIIFSTSLGNNTVLLYASYRKKNERVLPSSIIVPLVNLVTSIFAALVLFAFLGYMSVSQKVSIDSFPISGIDLPFVVYPALISMLPGANAWAVIFFLMLIISGANSLYPNVDSVIAIIYGVVKRCKCNPGRCCVTIWYCIISCLFSIIFSTCAGYYIFKLFDHYAVGINLIFNVFYQAIAIAWFYGFDKIIRLAHESTGETIPRWTTVFTKYLAPAFLLVFCVISFILEVSEDPGFPPWAIFIGWTFTCTPTLIVITTLIFRFIFKKDITNSGPYRVGENVDQRNEEYKI